MIFLLYYVALNHSSAEDNDSMTTPEYYGIHPPEDSALSPIFIIVPSVLLGVPLVVLGCICCKSLICRSCNSPDINIAVIKERKKKQKYQRPDTSSSTKPFNKRWGGQGSRSGHHDNSGAAPANRHLHQSRMIVEDLDPPGKDPGTLEARLADRKRKHRIRRKSMQVEPQVVHDKGHGEGKVEESKPQNMKPVSRLHPHWTPDNVVVSDAESVSVQRHSDKDEESFGESSVSTGHTEIDEIETPETKPRREHEHIKKPISLDMI